VKHNQKQTGFIFLPLLLVGLSFLLTLAGWYIHTHPFHEDIPMSAAPQYIPGKIGVEFRDGTTADQALAVVNSFGLTTSEDTDTIQTNFTPQISLDIKTDDFASLSSKLKQNPEVTDVVNPFPEPAYVHTSDTDINITFKQGTFASKDRQILSQAGINPVGLRIYRGITVIVPVGQENYYVAKFKQNPLVTSAEQGVQSLINNGDQLQ